MTEGRDNSSGLTWGQTLVMLSIILGLVAAIFGVAVHSINSSSNARFDDVNARFDRLGARIDARFDDIDARFDEIDIRFDDLEAKVDANTMFTTAFEGKRILTIGSSDSS